MKKFFTKYIYKLVCFMLLQFCFQSVQAQTIQVETYYLSGLYAHTITTPFAGVGFYANGDKADGAITLSNATGPYTITATGASSNSSPAKVDLVIDGTKVGTFSFTGSTPTTSTISVTFSSGTPYKGVQLLLSTDVGTNDTFVDAITFAYQGVATPPRAAPVVPTASTFCSGVYRNIFVESGKPAADVSAKMDLLWNQFFVNGDAATQKVYYPVGTDMAYIYDSGDDDIRTEGLSYGMMICVQLNKKAEFDKLWKFSKTYAQHPAGDPRQGLFSWHLNVNAGFTAIEDNPAPDGEEFFVTALFFANARWGSGTGIFNYKAEADYILDNMLNKASSTTAGCPTNLINTTEKQIVFAVCGYTSTFTDPSYHVPAFYDVWYREATNNKQLWCDMAKTSRATFWKKAANPVTGLMPDYSNFDGTPRTDFGTKYNFEFDAFRTIVNMSVDQAWFKQYTGTVTPLIDKQINFFKDKPGYNSTWTLDGINTNNYRSAGLIGSNAVAALALADAKIWPFVDEAYYLPIPTGKYRYYDGLLYMMSFMHLSGNFKLYTSGATTVKDTCNQIACAKLYAGSDLAICQPSNGTYKLNNTALGQTWILKSGSSTIDATTGTISGLTVGFHEFILKYTYTTDCSDTIKISVNVIPDLTITTSPATCPPNGGFTNNDAKINLVNTNNGIKVDYISGSVYTGTKSYSLLPTGMPAGNVIVVPNPNLTKNYTVRLFNNGGTCFVDKTLEIKHIDCPKVCPQKTCLPIDSKKN
jgi:endo-1,4-beta-D-glucanase Y